MSQSLPAFKPDYLREEVGVVSSGGVDVFLKCAVKELERQKLDPANAALDWLLLVRRIDLDEPLYGLGTYATVDYQINFELPDRYRVLEDTQGGDWTYRDVVFPESSDLSDYPWAGLAEVATEIAVEFEWGDAEATVGTVKSLVALPDNLLISSSPQQPSPNHQHTLVDLLNREWSGHDVRLEAIRSEVDRFGLKSIQRVREDQGGSPTREDLLPFLESERDETRRWAQRLLGRAGD